MGKMQTVVVIGSAIVAPTPDRVPPEVNSPAAISCRENYKENSAHTLLKCAADFTLNRAAAQSLASESTIAVAPTLGLCPNSGAPTRDYPDAK